MPKQNTPKCFAEPQQHFDAERKAHFDAQRKQADKMATVASQNLALKMIAVKEKKRKAAAAAAEKALKKKEKSE